MDAWREFANSTEQTRILAEGNKKTYAAIYGGILKDLQEELERVKRDCEAERDAKMNWAASAHKAGQQSDAYKAHAEALAAALRSILYGMGDNWRYVSEANRKTADAALAAWDKAEGRVK